MGEKPHSRIRLRGTHPFYRKTCVVIPFLSPTPIKKRFTPSPYSFDPARKDLNPTSPKKKKKIKSEKVEHLDFKNKTEGRKYRNTALNKYEWKSSRRVWSSLTFDET